MKFPSRRSAHSDDTHWLAKIVDLSGSIIPDIRQDVAQMMADHEVRHPELSQRMRSDTVSGKLIKKAALKACGVGGITAASAVLPGIGTLSALLAGTATDLAYVTRVQMDLCYGISAAYEVEMDHEELKAVAVSLIGFSGSTLAAKHVAAASLKNIIDGTASVFLKSGFSKAGVELFEKMSPRLLVRTFKLIPFAGIPLNGSINAALVMSVGKHAKKYFATWAGDMD